MKYRTEKQVSHCHERWLWQGTYRWFHQMHHQPVMLQARLVNRDLDNKSIERSESDVSDILRLTLSKNTIIRMEIVSGKQKIQAEIFTSWSNLKGIWFFSKSDVVNIMVPSSPYLGTRTCKAFLRTKRTYASSSTFLFRKNNWKKEYNSKICNYTR